MKISEIIETYMENQNKINKLNDNLKQLKETNKKNIRYYITFYGK
jgi:hypothetical protein